MNQVKQREILEKLIAKLSKKYDLVRGMFCVETSIAVSKELGISVKDGWLRTDYRGYIPHQFCVDYAHRTIIDICATQFNKYLKKLMPRIVIASVFDPLVDGKYYHINKQRVRLNKQFCYQGIESNRIYRNNKTERDF